jgi:hypothetical protein
VFALQFSSSAWIDHFLENDIQRGVLEIGVERRMGEEGVQNFLQFGPFLFFHDFIENFQVVGFFQRLKEAKEPFLKLL